MMAFAWASVRWWFFVSSLYRAAISLSVPVMALTASSNTSPSTSLATSSLPSAVKFFIM